MGERMHFGEQDQYFFGQATHYDIYKKLGISAHAVNIVHNGNGVNIVAAVFYSGSESDNKLALSDVEFFLNIANLVLNGVHAHIGAEVVIDFSARHG